MSGVKSKNLLPFQSLANCIGTSNSPSYPKGRREYAHILQGITYEQNVEDYLMIFSQQLSSVAHSPQGRMVRQLAIGGSAINVLLLKKSKYSARGSLLVRTTGT